MILAAGKFRNAQDWLPKKFREAKGREGGGGGLNNN